MLFFVKKFVSRFLFPLPLGLGLAILGLVLLWSSKRQRIGKVLVTLGVLLLLLLSTSSISDMLLQPLEESYPPFGMEGNILIAPEEVAFVVVLAGGIQSFPEYPITRQVGGNGMARLVEGIRVHRMCPNSKLVLSGGLGADPDIPRELLTNYRFVRLLGVAEEDLIIQNTSLDTAQEARNIKPIVGEAPFVLVTSAYHMPRALALFEKQGMHPIPAPSDYRIGLVRIWTPDTLFPNSGNLQKSEIAIYEFLGMVWARLRGLG